MIDEFINYVSNYDLNNIKIKLKYDHSIRVMNLMMKYAKELGFDSYEVELASVIGLLHDIGRFEQLKEYDSFNDKETIDHATLGIKLLFEDNLIKKFWSNKYDYELIKFAIKNHNKLNIEKCYNEKFLKYAKLIRDTDKIDILYVYGVSDELKVRSENISISKPILNCIKYNKTVSYDLINNKNDELSVSFSYIFDINYDICLKEFLYNLNILYNKLEYKEKFKEIYMLINEYVKDKERVIC